MGQVRTTFILILFFSASFSGCLSNEPTGEKIDLLVNYELNNGTVVESYSNGELTSFSKVTLDFDFVSPRITSPARPQARRRERRETPVWHSPGA